MKLKTFVARHYHSLFVPIFYIIGLVVFADAAMNTIVAMCTGQFGFATFLLVAIICAIGNTCWTFAKVIPDELGIARIAFTPRRKVLAIPSLIGCTILRCLIAGYLAPQHPVFGAMVSMSVTICYVTYAAALVVVFVAAGFLPLKCAAA